MYQRTRQLVVAALVVLAMPIAAHAQRALAAGTDEPGGPSGMVNRALLAAALKQKYQLHLTSDWPQLAAPDGSCLNGGSERIDGGLELTSGGDYVGTLTRSTTINFCGGHGQARDACVLVLRSEGPVAARGEIQPFMAGWTSPVVELHWSTATEGNEVTLDGDCSSSFNDALRRMYLGVSHVLEFPLPTVGEAGRRERLEDYGWNVEVE
jgi:hypothetical protein